jgi:hypothetical protein
VQQRKLTSNQTIKIMEHIRLFVEMAIVVPVVIEGESFSFIDIYAGNGLCYSHTPLEQHRIKEIANNLRGSFVNTYVDSVEHNESTGNTHVYFGDLWGSQGD